MDDKAEKQAGYQRKYEEKRVFKKVSFNIGKEADLLEIGLLPGKPHQPKLNSRLRNAFGSLINVISPSCGK